ncbi:hypothetical protein ANCCEY_05353 [Ancylostoma ceylanicum]|uniref:Reverse transcriptase domain-containing protein n=1 Tax=Ancylostoma ceylanicum TaxID=53326 RepID=A0A0D6LZP7_9BILA|nr:hypothetical protein ANCCEY_05353 [Ancylostoma ceylanicum]
MAKRLQLEDVDSKRLTISTFGPNTPIVKTFGITVVRMWEVNGAPRTFTTTRGWLAKQYHDTIQTQLNQGIIERLDESREHDGDVVHYLAIGNVAITSHVEKAFLEVRIHPQDRDAKRFIWLADPILPVSPDNMVVYHCSRVTFGLVYSPFLLVGTIKHHLENHPTNKDVAHKIENNMYVDNVVLTSPSTTDAMNFYKESREIFEDINVNLREFLSNNDEIKQHVAVKDLSADFNKNILGTPWKFVTDTFLISCEYPTRAKITKRTVCKQVAAV